MHLSPLRGFGGGPDLFLGLKPEAIACRRYRDCFSSCLVSTAAQLLRPTRQAVELKGSAQETIESLLSALPRRIFQKRDNDRTGQLKAAELTFALTQTREGANEFFKAAQYAMARRLSINAHEMKYPIAMFEEYRRVSPEWRPHLLAATSVYLQGTNSQNNPAVERGVKLLAGTA
jgi:hypothetical protein